MGAIGDALALAGAMAWQILWALILGFTWTVSSLVDRQLNLPGSADRRNGYGIDTTSVHR